MQIQLKLPFCVMVNVMNIRYHLSLVHNLLLSLLDIIHVFSRKSGTNSSESKENLELEIDNTSHIMLLVEKKCTMWEDGSAVICQTTSCFEHFAQCVFYRSEFNPGQGKIMNVFYYRM